MKNGYGLMPKVTTPKIRSNSITTAKIRNLTPEELSWMTPMIERMKKLMKLQDEFYKTRPIRRWLKKHGLIGNPDMKARTWALARYHKG